MEKINLSLLAIYFNFYNFCLFLYLLFFLLPLVLRSQGIYKNWGRHFALERLTLSVKWLDKSALEANTNLMFIIIYYLFFIILFLYLSNPEGVLVSKTAV